jgi:hypothetical protein
MWRLDTSGLFSLIARKMFNEHMVRRPYPPFLHPKDIVTDRVWYFYSEDVGTMFLANTDKHLATCLENQRVEFTATKITNLRQLGNGCLKSLFSFLKTVTYTVPTTHLYMLPICTVTFFYFNNFISLNFIIPLFGIITKS